MKEKYSKGQLKTLADFFCGLSIAWFTAGMITPYFSRLNFSDRVSVAVSGLIFGYIFIKISIEFSLYLD